MTIEYKVTAQDAAVLRQHVPYPCTASQCSKVPTGDDAYCFMGCGHEAHCVHLNKYRAYREKVQKAGLDDLDAVVQELASLLAERKKINTAMTGKLAGIGNKYGHRVLTLICDEVFDGEL